MTRQGSNGLRIDSTERDNSHTFLPFLVSNEESFIAAFVWSNYLSWRREGSLLAERKVFVGELAQDCQVGHLSKENQGGETKEKVCSWN